MTNGFKPPAPIRDAETAPFWDAAKEDRLLLKQCDSCAEIFYYPRLLCPFCLSSSHWIEASGAGEIYSYSEIHQRDGSYVLALVTLAEGPTMMTNIMTVDAGTLRVGQPVRVEFIDTIGEERLPVFVPA